MIVRVLEEEPDEVPAPTREPSPRRSRRPLALGVLAALGLGALVIVQEGGGRLISEEVPSYWGEVPMTCDTLRMEQGGRAIERFKCRALGGRALPSGLFEPPDSAWASDITGRESKDSRIRISPDGEVEGWAIY